MKQEKGVHEIRSGLCRMRISLSSSLSAATGFLVARPGTGPEILPLVLGTFLLACGASALNQYQERDIDALMPRTRTRPIPSGRIHAGHALLFSLMFISSGTTALLLTGSISASLLGLAGVVWYNGLYTPMKRKTAFAAVPGALVGTITPAIGWVAGHGSLADPRLLALCFFFFMWQVPHFWLLLLNRGEEYEKAGLPSLSGVFSGAQLRRILFIWILAAAVSSLFLSSGDVVRTPLLRFFLLGASLWLAVNGMTVLRPGKGATEPGLAFRRINIYLFIIMALLSADKLIG